MATPTPGSASKRAPGGVSTPSHLNQSSPPRSVPSPVTARHPAGKTPVNHPTTGSSQGSKTLGSTPMVHTLSHTGNTSSPSANMLSFSTPNGLGIEGMTPAGLNMPTPALSGAAMMPSMSELGLTASRGKRDEDEERRAKMRKVLKAIGKPKGRVSEEGIARISRRVGFANDIDAEKLTQEEKERKVGNRTISTAGNTIVIEIDLKQHVPRSVQVMYSTQTKALEEQGEKAGRVLLEDLQAHAGLPIQVTLDRFAANLERLATVDRLSSSGVNCFEALGGIYASLSRLYDREKEATRALLKAEDADNEGRVDSDVICKMSGKPVMHERGKLGFAIEYWRVGNGGVRGTKMAAREGGMEVDDQSKHHDHADFDSGDQIFSLSISAEAASAALYPSLRTAELWLPDPLPSPDDESNGGIPWQDPPPTLIPATSVSDAIDADGQQKLPDLRFVAKLDPPLVVPYQTATNVLAAVGVSQAPVISMPPAYAVLLLGQQPEVSVAQQPLSVSMSAHREVISHRLGQETTVQHSYTLDNVKLDWGYMLDELPFAHPRQLIELLPTLRQWTCMGNLLKSTLKPEISPAVGSVNSKSTNGVVDHYASLDELLDVSSEGSSSEKVPISISLATSPTPTIGIAFSTSDDKGVANISVQVLPNAVLSVSTQEGILPEDIDDAPTKLQNLARALEVCGDLGLWTEWLRTSISS